MDRVSHFSKKLYVLHRRNCSIWQSQISKNVQRCLKHKYSSYEYFIKNNQSISSYRSVNIIEEENLGTTISGYKFTGRQTELSHDVGFRNIHS